MTQKNLVYAINLPESIAEESILSQPNYFGQFGPIQKIVVKPRHNSQRQRLYSAYITFKDVISASFCVLAVDGIHIESNQIKASYGMTKYCTFFINGQVCLNEDCVFLHRLPRKSGKKSGYDYEFISKLTKKDIEDIILDSSTRAIQEAEVFLVKMRGKVTEGQGERSLPSPVPILNRLKRRDPKRFEGQLDSEIKSVQMGGEREKKETVRNSWHADQGNQKGSWDNYKIDKGVLFLCIKVFCS